MSFNPFSTYIDCINCGNELTNVSELSFRTPEKIQCDFCGQTYPGLSRKVKRTKTAVTLIFAILGLLIFWWFMTSSGISSGLFALFPLLIIYYFTLGFAVRGIVRF